MQPLQIDAQRAKTLYKTAAPEFKAMLLDSFGEKHFAEKITDRIKSFADACQATGRHEDFIQNRFEEELSADELAYMQLKIIAEALNEGWKPDWNNSNEKKWSPWFWMDKPGFRFDGAICGIASAHATGGSRLCFKSSELAEYAGKQFLDIYKSFLS